MSAAEIFERNADHTALCIFLLSRNRADCHHTTCTAYSKHTFILRVNVQEQTSLQIRSIHIISTKHADLLIYGKYSFNGRMCQTVIIQDRQRISNSDSVVTAKRSSLCLQIISIYLQIQSVGLQILFAICSLHCHHIHMSLNDQRLRLLIPCGTIFPDDHIIFFILTIFKTMLFCK